MVAVASRELRNHTRALLDRCLKMGTHFLKKGGWDW
jgi:hypothetical protein